METFLENFDYFTGKSMLDRHKLKFHADYLRARAIYYDNIMVFPDLGSHLGGSAAKDPTKALEEESKENLNN